ncbi:MAG: hypothetical protein NTU97_03170, partial [Candidatus Magasanikbacteria bacterium]|nr:hypothetical protein [Candidatus Magasanikbacteria bacterium]
MTVQNEKPAESGEIKAPPKKTKTTSNLDAGAVAKFKDMLFARKSYARSRADRTTGENLEDARESALEEERRRLAKEASSTSSVEALVAVGKQASELILQQREQAIQDRFKVGSEKREMLSALESMGKLRLDLATQYPEYFKLQDDGLISFDLGHWIQEESDLIEGHIRNNEERGLVSEIYKRRGEIRAVVREKVSKMIDRVLVVSGKGENNLDLLFLGPDEQEMGLLFLRTLRDSSGRSYSIEKENVPRYKSVLGAVVKAESIFGISHRSEERRVQMRRIIKFSLQAEELFIDSYTAREHLSDTPSILQTNRDEFLGSLSISEMRSFGFENILIGRL